LLVVEVPFAALLVTTASTVPIGQVLHCKEPGRLKALAPTHGVQVDALVAPAAVEKVTGVNTQQQQPQ
jgi:hypothetical protein